MRGFNIIKRNYNYAHLVWLKSLKNERNLEQNFVEQKIHDYEERVAHCEAIEKEIDNLHAHDPDNNLLVLCFSEYNKSGYLWNARRITCHSVQDAIETYETLSAEAHKLYYNTTGIIELRSREEEQYIEELQNQIDELKEKLDNLIVEFDTLTKEEEDDEY